MEASEKKLKARVRELEERSQTKVVMGPPAPVNVVTPPSNQVLDLVESLIVGRTAESLRRREAEHWTLGVAVRATILSGAVPVVDSTTEEKKACTCREDAELVFQKVTNLPRKEDHAKLDSIV